MLHFFFESSGLTGSKRYIMFENGPLYKTMFHLVFQELLKCTSTVNINYRLVLLT